MKRFKGIKAVLFDMDGVLLDSEEYIRDAAVEMFREKGYRVPPEDFKAFTGMGENRYLGGVAEKNGIPFDLTRDKARTYEIYSTLVQGRLQPYPGVAPFIRDCIGMGLKTALASSADRVKVEINLKETGLSPELFGAIVTGEDIEHKKPAPDIFLKAASLLQIPPGQCLVVEDAVSGVAAGKAAGCRVLALTTSFPAEELHAADRVAASLADASDDFFSGWK